MKDKELRHMIYTAIIGVLLALIGLVLGYFFIEPLWSIPIIFAAGIYVAVGFVTYDDKKNKR